MINILMVVPNIEDATSLYRASGPFSELRRVMPINLVFVDKIGENMLDLADIVFIQRPHADNHLQLAKMCVNSGIPLWIDYDDFLLAVPEDNPAFDIYNQPKIREAMVHITKAATVVTVSTTQLATMLKPINERVYVVPNCIPERFMRHARKYEHKKHVNWRGSNTHQRDVAEVGPELIELAEKRKDTTFTFIGYNPWFVTSHMPPKQAIVIPPMAIGEYFRFMQTTGPAVQIVPLASHMFNLCKSNIAALEGIIAGAVPIVPDWPEWEMPGAFKYKDSIDFRKWIEWALDDHKNSARMHADALSWVREHRDMRVVNKIRADIVHALMDHRRGVDTFPPFQPS